MNEVCSLTGKGKQCSVDEDKEFGIKLKRANQVFEKLQFISSESIKQILLLRFNSQMQEITSSYINNHFPAHYR